jgi:hypothetical protein
MVAVRLPVVIRECLTVVAGSSIHVNREKRERRRKKEGLGVLKRVAGRGQVMIPRESFYVYAVYVHTVEGKARINGGTSNPDGVA